MSLEFWSTIASIGTFFVIAATAIAALVQLRHMQSSNQIAALSDATRYTHSEPFRKAQHHIREELPRLLNDPTFMAKAVKNLNLTELESVRHVAAVYETLGSYVKFGAIDPRIVVDLMGDPILDAWKDVEPVLAIARAHSPFLWENFEYLVVLNEDFRASHPGGSYPVGVRRKKFDKS